MVTPIGGSGTAAGWRDAGDKSGLHSCPVSAGEARLQGDKHKITGEGTSSECCSSPAMDCSNDLLMDIHASTVLHNNLGGEGGKDGDDASLLPECDGLTQNDDCSRAMVFGNVVAPAQLPGLTGGAQIGIDLWVEATTDYVPAGELNHLRESNDVPTFGEINLRGPGDQDGLNSVGLTFTFKRRDNRAEVTIPWMQLTFFDFDQDPNQGGNAGRECVEATGFVDYALSSGGGNTAASDSPTTIETVQVSNGAESCGNGNNGEPRGTTAYNNNCNAIDVNTQPGAMNTGKWCSTVGGTGGDNPNNPQELDEEKDRKSTRLNSSH